MSRTGELVVLALLSALTFVGSLLWAHEGLMLWLSAAFRLCL